MINYFSGLSHTEKEEWMLGGGCIYSYSIYTQDTLRDEAYGPLDIEHELKFT